MARSQEFHENLARDDEVERGSDRAFGLVVGGVLALIGGARAGFGGVTATNAVLLGAGAALVVLGVVAPARLAPLARIWFRLGLLASKIVNPLVLGLVFFSTVTPIGLLLRMVGADPLRLKRDPDAKSYWIDRKAPGPSPESMKHQF